MRITGLRNILLVTVIGLASIGVSIAFLEVATGYLYERAGLANGKRTIDLYLDRPTEFRSSVKGAENASVTPHPYLLYTHTPNFTANGYRQTNSLGYRNEEFAVEKPGNTIRILVLGGSTTFMWPYIKNPADTWVARLEGKLQAISSRRVQVINAGINYGTSAEALAGYVFRHRFLQPDIVIYHGGGNDVLPLFFEHYNPEYTHFRSQGSGTVPRPGEKTLLARSNIGKYLYARWLEPVGSIFVTKPFWEVDPQVALERVKRQDSEGFERNIDYLVTLSKSSGSDVVLFGFLQARKENLSKNAGAFKGFEEALVVGLEKHYDVLQKVARRHTVPFLIPDQDRFDDDWFQDNCHLTPAGEEVKAQIMFEELRKHPQFSQSRGAAGVSTH
ncbi:MAG: GDSL-type esterase/lipase family protein [Nitrospira sp.]|nr:GDSL-type esterase/lipase family protein [Nitrospira sp.]